MQGKICRNGLEMHVDLFVAMFNTMNAHVVYCIYLREVKPYVVRIQNYIRFVFLTNMVMIFK